ncbi:MAG: hypothetical protein EP330_06585 [Deltaproteobacteria bacterium]|nr:MAG: hypothetical protein EP330_06585 [Deltaproteobacteria bacterium]
MWWVLALAHATPLTGLQTGDVLFQESRSAQASAIRAATGSRYTHVAVVIDDGWVLEAVQPVKRTAVDAWVARGVDGHFVAHRPVIPLSSDEQARLRDVGATYIGRDYDAAFSWDDGKLYCSELVYKLFLEATGREIGERQPVRSFAIDGLHEALQARGIDLDTQVVAPESQRLDRDLRPLE